MAATFNLAKFLERSKALDLTGIDWSKASDASISDDEARCLTYMIDVESYTIAYLRDLLNTKALKDREIADFLPCWAYEESYHGRALERVLQEAGRPLDPARAHSYQRRKRIPEVLKDLGAVVVSNLSEHFIAVYMTWGAINELTALNGYRHLSRKTRNEVLAEVCRRISHDEARHFGFYYAKAQERLEVSEGARRLTRFMVGNFWAPVGSGVCPESEVRHMGTFLYGDEEGRESARQIDATVKRLPGMEWFDLMTKAVRKN